MNTRVLSCSLLLATALENVLAQPVVTKQPTDQSVSLGASAKFQISATSAAPPIRYQWRLTAANLDGQTNSSLTLTNIQVINAGDYDAVLADSSGSVTSRLAKLTVDPTFTKITTGPIVTEGGMSWACVWGDYDNDGYLDLFVTNGDFANGKKNFLYHNNGDGTFARITNSVVSQTAGDSTGCAWGDYDNDGYLDLFVANLNQRNFLYHNNGNGTFTKITEGSLVNDGGPGVPSVGCSWGDYDNDGFLDLIVANGGGPGPAEFNNFLYRNKGNSNGWMKVKCIGTFSNRSSIGTKLKVKATIGGKTFWQLREVTGGDGFASGSPVEVHFGLGNATNVEVLSIEWPSGAVQEFQNVAVKQYLTITEPSRLMVTSSSGAPQFTLQGGRGLQYDVQVSADLKTWSPLSTITITNLDGVALIIDTNAMSSGDRFYRAVLR